ncbi:helix-turn-helix transcriptional regulator [Pseudonocardia halophobica]|uniref:helix-turn-helix transcriptional regulator n=1 Tax=Pseudonocardia halophobica TaxID=29401 RepID=UPI0012DF99B8|nr:AAA family ATPase [Pseudonocardia halophobica]
MGRDRELAALTGMLAAALTGDPRLVLCGGEPGIGRTRLATELAARAAADRVPVAWGAGAGPDVAPPFLPWRQVLRGLPGPAPPAGGSDLAPLTDGVAAVEEEDRFRLFDTVVRVLHAAAEPAGLLVVLDDVHRADPASLRLLHHVAAQLRGGRLLLVATHDDTAGPASLPSGPAVDRLALRRLPPQAVAVQLADVVGAAVPVDQAERVHELSAGNPFLAAELGRDLAEGRPIGVPVGVREAVGRWLGRLSPRCRHELRIAAVLGPCVDLVVLAAVVGRPLLECLDPIDEAADAGLLEPGDAPGRYRFVHPLVRDAVEAGLPGGERVRLHRAAVDAILRHAGDRVDPHLADLARHWAAAAVAGERAEASAWIERAAAAAVRTLAFEEGARLYRLALDVGDAAVDAVTRHRLLTGLAAARFRAADPAGAVAAAGEAIAVAHGPDRPRLVADAVLTLGCTNDQGLDRTVRALCEEALAGAVTGPRRARLLALLTETDMYLEDVAQADSASREALAAAEGCGDASALVAALRARQLARSGPDGVEERTVLAQRLLAATTARDEARLWAHLWLIDALVERGELFDAAAELDRLEWVAGRYGGATARWHVLKVKAMLAQAHGRLAEAARLGAEAFAAAPGNGTGGAVGSRLALLTAVDHHAGTATALEALAAAGGPLAAGSGYRITFTLGPALMLTDAGRLPEAGALYRSLGPPAGWRPAPFFLLTVLSAGVAVAGAQGAAADVAALRGLLLPHRGRHVGSGAGVAHYGGPVTLHLGSAAARLGELDTAVDELRSALATCRTGGAAGYAVEAQTELAAVLARRGRTDDLGEAATLVAEGRTAAEGLGMPGFAARLAALDERLRRAPAALLTAREREVAACVARGMSNPQIAAALVVSERTAQNHVQHILTKLGFSRRSQIAVWAVHNLGTRT